MAFEIVVAVYTILLSPVQTDEGPVIEVPAGKGVTFIGKFDITLPHPLVPVTETFPELAPNSTLIEFVPCPDSIVEPEGTLQV